MEIRVGVDIGQRVDPTAIAITELQWRPPSEEMLSRKAYVDHHVVRHLERLPLGTTYPLVVKRIKYLVETVSNRVEAGSLANKAGWLVSKDYANFILYVDATGVGQPVVDELKAAGIKVTGVYFTASDKRLEQRDELTNDIRVMLGKAYMVSRLQALLQTRRIHLPNTDEAKAAGMELLNYEIHVSEKGGDSFGVFKTGKHDDLVTAIGLCVNKPPQYAASVTSTEGFTPQPVPEWAGFGDGKLPTLNQDFPFYDPFGKRGGF